MEKKELAAKLVLDLPEPTEQVEAVKITLQRLLDTEFSSTTVTTLSEQKYKEGVASLRIIDAALSSVLKTFEDISKTADSLERELNKEGSKDNE